MIRSSLLLGPERSSHPSLEFRHRIYSQSKPFLILMPLSSFLADHQPACALVIGGGFIGLETAEALVNQQLNVTIVEKASQILPVLDADMAGMVAVTFDGTWC